eukprot:COSAG05_NODE_985_length_6290_cov_2.922953_5_plen_96_part_00
MQRTSDVVSGLGDSAMGLVAILTSGISTAAFTLGGLPWLLTNVVAMEKYFILGAGAIIGGVSFKLGSDYPAGETVHARPVTFFLCRYLRAYLYFY